MTTAHEIRNLIKQTTTGTRCRRVPEEVKEQVRRYAERRRTQAATWKAIGGRRASRPASSARGVGRCER
jgi:hypothetical protein